MSTGSVVPGKEPIGLDDPQHGTANGYHNLGCRCDPCKAAWSAYQSRTRDAPPEISDPAALRYMAGETAVNRNVRSPFFVGPDGAKDVTDRTGRRYRSVKHRHGSGVHRRGRNVK